MKNHFYISYVGNKRSEVNKIYENINFEGIDTVIEPYCGSCAMSYYIWTKHPNFKFILNDNNHYLLEMFNIIRDDDKLNEFEIKINELMPIFLNNKDDYINFVKQNNVYSWFFANKFYSIRPGLFPQNKKIKNVMTIRNCPIINFFRNANIEFYNMDATECYKNYKNNENNLILLDPPYMDVNNTLYRDPTNEIYEYLHENDIDQEKAKIYLILEKMWIMDLLFKDNEKIIYDKTYTSFNKKKTSHMIIKQKSN